MEPQGEFRACGRTFGARELAVIKHPGLGPRTYKSQRGVHLHPTFMVTPERLPLGVFNAWIWARDDETFGQSTKHLPIEARESVRWLEGYQRLVEVADQLPDTQIVYVADREADIDELFVEAQGAPIELLVHANHERELTDGAKLRKLREFLSGTIPFDTARPSER